MDTETRIRVEDVMSSPLETIPATATVAEAATKMYEADISALFVTTPSGGIITNTDIRNAVAEGRDPSDTGISEVMTTPVETITAHLLLEEAAAMMTNFGIKHLPVVDREGDYVGMISTTDLTIALA